MLFEQFQWETQTKRIAERAVFQHLLLEVHDEEKEGEISAKDSLADKNSDVNAEEN